MLNNKVIVGNLIMLNRIITHWKVATLAVLLLSVSACGQKGDLYLPGEEQATTQSSLTIYV